MASFCEYLCNPDNHMKPSCDEKCPAYVYTGTTNATVLDPIRYVEGSIATTVTFIMIPIAVVLAIIVLFCLLKKQIRGCRSKIRDKKLKFSQQVEDDQASGRMIELNDLNASNTARLSC